MHDLDVADWGSCTLGALLYCWYQKK